MENNKIIIKIAEYLCELDASLKTWDCTDPQLETILNVSLRRYEPSPSDPNPLLTLGKDAIARYGGKIIERPKYYKAEVVE